MSYNYKHYQTQQERRVNRKVATADIPFLVDVPDAYDVDDAIAEDEFAVFKHKELQRWYIDETNEGGTGSSQDFYVALMIGWTTVDYQKTLEIEFGAKMYGESMYFDTEASAVEAMSWVASMRTMAAMTGKDTITFEGN